MQIKRCNYSYKIDETDSLDCDYPVYRDGKCILHCNKDDWNLPEIINHEHDYPDYSSFVSTLRQELEKTNFDLLGVNFPKTKIKSGIFFPLDKIQYEEGREYRTIHLKLKDCICLDDFVLEIEDSVRIDNCILKKKLIIGDKIKSFDSHSSDLGIIEILNENRKNDEIIRFFIYSTNIDNLNIKSIYIETMFISNSKIQSVAFERTSIKSHLKLRDNPIIKNAKFDIMLFDENSYVEIENCNFEDLTINNCHAQPKYFSLLNSKVEKSVTITGSELNNYAFDTVDMSKAKILMYNSNFMGNSFTKFNNVKWGEFVLWKDINNRDTFRQLKHVNDQQGNYIQANKFYSLEMEKYGEEVSATKNFPEWLVFVISKNLSNFSQSWILPILWFGFISMFLYNILTIDTISNLQSNKLWAPQIFMSSNYRLILAFHLLLLFVCTVNLKGCLLFIIKRLLIYANIIAFVYSIALYVNLGDAFPKLLVSLEEFIKFSNPLDFSLPDNYNWLYLVLMILHRLFTFVIGYHFVTALRFNTRRK